MTHVPTQAYGDAAFRDPLDWEDGEDGAQPAFPARPRALTLSPARVGSSLQMIVLLGLASWGLVYLAVQIGMAIIQRAGGAF